MHKVLERINKKSHKFIKRPILTNSHKFLAHKNVPLRYIRVQPKATQIKYSASRSIEICKAYTWGRVDFDSILVLLSV